MSKVEIAEMNRSSDVSASSRSCESRSRHVCRANNSLHQPVLLHVRSDNVTLDLHPAAERAEAPRLRPRGCHWFDASDRLPAQRHRQRFPILLHVLEHLNAFRFEF